MLPLSKEVIESGRGALLAFEGCDKIGKSTQCAMLVEFLNNGQIPAKLISFPNRETLSGQLLNSYLIGDKDISNEEIQLLFAANRWEMQSTMRKLLQEGTTLVVDRYSFSGVAYGVAKGLSFDWCQSPEIGLLRPDRVFFLDVQNVNCLLKRTDFGQERYEHFEFQSAVAQMFRALYGQEQRYWTKFNGKTNIHTLHELVSNEAMKVIKAVEGTPVQLLWKA